LKFNLKYFEIQNIAPKIKNFKNCANLFFDLNQKNSGYLIICFLENIPQKTTKKKYKKNRKNTNFHLKLC